ncbi:MAG: hypothetical protein LBS99_00670 [Clostridiales bacterium]|jgi:hypothetical protein|nr:hypothetical protein [Clostridiales bacterium]
MANEVQTSPNKANGIAATIFTGFFTVILGVYLLIGAVGTLPFELTLANSWLPAMFFTFWLICWSNGAIRKSGFLTYVAFVFGTLGLMFALINGGTGFSVVWPLLVALPGIASFFAIWGSKVKRFHVKSVIFFGSMAAFWFLFSSGVIAQWWIVFIVCVVLVGVFIVINAVTSRRGQWDDGDRPQRKR